MMDIIHTTPMDKEWLSRLDKHGFTGNTVYGMGEWEDLKTKLLNAGGEAVILVVRLDDYDRFLNEGEFFLSRPTMFKMASHACHDNVEELCNTIPSHRSYTGFALSEDGAWRFHSWAVKNGEVIETTTPRLCYYGIPDFWK